MKKEKVCRFCQELIDLKHSKYVLLGTYEGKDVLDESYFHWDCFNRWYNSKVKQKTENVLKDASKRVGSMLGSLKKLSVAGTSGGGDEVIDVGFDMEKEVPKIDFSQFADTLNFKKDKKKNAKRKNKKN